MEACIDNCLECYEVCLETKQHCLELGGEHANPKHIQALSDCLELCQVSAHFMIKDSNLHGQVCGVCAEACRVGAESCEEYKDDEMMQHCAEVCRQCEKSCREMAGV
jgi:hypothetical protein